MFRRKLKPDRQHRWSERLFRRFVFKYFARNLYVDLQLQAKRETLRYVNRHMRHCLHFQTRWQALRHAVQRVTGRPGLIAEFGVYKGDSIRVLAACTDRIVHGFDSFRGLPEDWGGTGGFKGMFDTGGSLPDVPDNVRLHPGWFEDSLPGFLDAHPDPVALLHVDCDIYSATRTVLDSVADRIAPGCVLVFDEYFNYPNWQSHEFKAFQEFVEKHGVRYRYDGFTIYDGAVMLSIVGVGESPGPVGPDGGGQSAGT